VSDEELLRRLQARDSRALEALYDRYSRLAFGLALRVLGDRDQAEDVVQDAYLALWRAAGTYQAERGAVRTWLLTIVRNRAIDRLRCRAATSDVESLEAVLSAPEADVWAQVSRQLLREEIVGALGQLPPEQRRVVELAYFGGFSHAEIANITTLPLGTVKGRMRMALQKLRGALGVREPERAS
jgi:RNA polymerase sigma-70 factor (ECF subfamily)